ncbi:conserved exported hypothetical protein [Planktothrix serta PCC 8927]|uniref:Uncharacterized protein n=1 Tax=Planktothrix serta PCC 8927 TaxID=671068 RepID=A0A7Z9BHW8_9CYAN|nr:hypothetical protein [Planktothrix serta]VXD11382.1 conserved exported hypothetical protein [Planktothrix serta PCC 8927]
MQRLILRLKQVSVRWAIALILTGLIGVGWGIFMTPVVAESLTPKANFYNIPGKNTENLDLQKASDAAKNASEKVFDQLDTTKKVVGKTEKRNEAIENARNIAHKNLNDQADRAKAAENPDVPLGPNEKLFYKGLQGEL